MVVQWYTKFARSFSASLKMKFLLQIMLKQKIVESYRIFFYHNDHLKVKKWNHKIVSPWECLYRVRPNPPFYKLNKSYKKLKK